MFRIFHYRLNSIDLIYLLDSNYACRGHLARYHYTLLDGAALIEGVSKMSHHHNETNVLQL